jgi:hypothetical protein
MGRAKVSLSFSCIVRNVTVVSILLLETVSCVQKGEWKLRETLAPSWLVRPSLCTHLTALSMSTHSLCPHALHCFPARISVLQKSTDFLSLHWKKGPKHNKHDGDQRTQQLLSNVWSSEPLRTPSLLYCCYSAGTAHVQVKLCHGHAQKS